MKSDVSFEEMRLKNKTRVNFSFMELLEPLFRLRAKYYNLKTMEHFDGMDKAKKENEKIDKESPWKSHKDELKTIDKEFGSIREKKSKRELDN